MGNTPNLNLYKGTPGSSTETFNVQTMLNDNWDKLDIEVVKKASTTEDGRMAKEDKAKLNSIEEGATNYQHPATHSATMITEDTTHRFVMDAEKADWNAKETPSGAQSKVDMHANRTDNPHNVTVGQIGAEPIISVKGTAFNKDFGTVAGTVTEGNDPRLSDARVADGGNADTVNGSRITVSSNPPLNPVINDIWIEV